MSILIRGVDVAACWIMRIVPGIAILHTVYGIYHLCRNAAGKPPASSALYHFFASFLDISIVPFYAFSALVARRESGWSSLLKSPSLTSIFSQVAFYVATAGGGIHFLSFFLSIYLAAIFRKITKLPPDMNPLEENLTSRHKRNKSSITTVTTTSGKSISDPLESKRSSGATYSDLSRPPTVPFLHTRTLSTDSFSTYRATPPPSRDGRLDLPSRQYQISAGSSTADIKRNSGYGTPRTPPKRAAYTEVPLSDTSSMRSSKKMGSMAEAWYTADSLPPRSSRSSSPKKGAYVPLHQQIDSLDDVSFSLPNPLSANPPTPRHNHFPSRDSPLSEISNNRASSDIADTVSRFKELDLPKENFKAKYYGELKPGTPPVMVGGTRQVSSGTDIVNSGSFRAVERRDVSGKIAEEGRGGVANGWGTRFRKVSGLGGRY